MTEVWIYRVDLVAFEAVRGENTVPNLTGFRTVTSDEEYIGTVEESAELGERSWIVVDTGHWIFEKKRMIPAGAISAIDPEQRQVRLALTREEVRSAPDYHEISRHEAFYQAEIEDYYRSHAPASR